MLISLAFLLSTALLSLDWAKIEPKVSAAGCALFIQEHTLELALIHQLGERLDCCCLGAACCLSELLG